MARDEIIAGIKNAMERGISLEDAKKSFMGAGYNPIEVQEAAASISSGASEVIEPQTKQTPKRPTQIQQTPPQQSFVQPTQQPQGFPSTQPQTQKTATPPQKDKGKKTKIIILSIILTLLIIAGVLAFIFKDKILGLFG